MTLDYYYGDQAEQFSFYRIPKVLFTDSRFKDISAEAKILYGLLLDRMSLSAKNGWLDQEGRVYIVYTVEDIMDALSCASQKAMKLLNELDEKCGLIERKRQGLGKPNLIYVKNFVSAPESKFKNGENQNSGLLKIETQEFPKSKGSNTEKNNTDFNDTESFPFPSFRDGQKRESKGNDAERRAQYRELSSAQTPASSETPTPTTEPITKEDGTGFTQNGNSVTRDLLYDKYSNKQFITVETRNGETFYLVIDYDKPLDEDGERYETYFLNLVDEADLLALVEGDKQTPVCSCTTKCEAGAVNTSCEVCKTNMTECTGKEKVVEKVPDTTPEPEVEPEPEKKSSGGAVALLLLLVLGGGGALYWFKFRKKKPDAKGPVDLDDYDYGEEDDGEEYETEPDEGESADAAQDEE